MEWLIGTDWVGDDPEAQQQLRVERWLRQTFKPGAEVRLVAEWVGIPPGTVAVVVSREASSFLIRWKGRLDTHWFPLESITLLWLEPLSEVVPPKVLDAVRAQSIFPAGQQFDE